MSASPYWLAKAETKPERLNWRHNSRPERGGFFVQIWLIASCLHFYVQD
jgi:hypothetical protein